MRLMHFYEFIAPVDTIVAALKVAHPDDARVGAIPNKPYAPNVSFGPPGLVIKWSEDVFEAANAPKGPPRGPWDAG